MVQNSFPIIFMLIFKLGCLPLASDQSEKLSPAFGPQKVKPPQDLPERSLNDNSNQCLVKSGDLAQGDCKPGLICVPQTLDKKEGLCLKDCGQNQDGHLAKVNGVCEASEKCMLLKDHELISLGMFCLLPQNEINQPCQAPFDEQACGEDLSCLPTASFEDDFGKTIYGLYRCKEECHVKKSCRSAKEQCNFAHARQENQPSIDGKKSVQYCEISLCQSAPLSCPCNDKTGFYCRRLMDGLDRGTCVRALGVCEES